ncbi:MAG: cellulase family glycosylhydrolase [Ruminococcus sp.]|nr:cellulase family glycosylhydrolase [Ruminococcus sp.]
MRKWNGYQKGVNLGGWLSQAELTDEHCRSFIKRSDIENIRGMGFDHLRLPVDYNLVQNETGEFREDGFDYIDRCIQWCGELGLNMILDLHKTAGFSFDEGGTDFFHSERLILQFISLWSRFAQRYGRFSGRLAFELLNEVVDEADNEPWMKIAERTVREIRRYAPDIKILIGGYMNNSVTAVSRISPPFDENIIYNFHCYEPLLFTHQGAYWIKGMPGSFRMEYPVGKTEFLERSESISAEIERFENKIPDSGFSAEYFERLFSDALKTAEERGVMLYCGEYGVIELADGASALNWYRDIHSVLEKYGIGRALWCYKGKDFGLTDGMLSEIKDEILGLSA